MYKYKATESHDGSHFFVKTPNDCIIRISLFKPNEDYSDQYLEDKVRHLLITNYTDTKLTRTESKGICETIAHIAYEFLAYNDCVLKIEVRTKCGKDHGVKRLLETRPPEIKGFVKENLDDCILYFLFNINKIESTDLLSSLISEYENND
jgi:hypothetical protein